ncbi:MAG: alpha/beta hydrolase domain-containing protein [Myxococcota bacterium]
MKILGPVSGGLRGWPFAAAAFDLAAQGYVEEEWFVEGEAATYRHRSGATRAFDGRWEAEVAGSAPYRTRVLVRRPSDPARWNGSACLLWNNVSHGFDLLVGESAELYDGGFALVAVSAQAHGVHGYPGGVTPGLVVWDPERYGSLHVPGDEVAYDIYTQAARLARSGELGFTARRVIGVGASQSAVYLATYLNAIQPLSRALDACILDIYFGNGSQLRPQPSAVGDPSQIAAAVKLMPPGSHLLRDDLGIPVFVLNSESEATLHHPVRQPDGADYRYWEVAGVAHGSRVRGTERIPSSWPRDLGTNESRIGTPPDANPLRLDEVRSAVLRHVQRWLAEGIAPPIQPLIEFDVRADGSPVIRRDALGLARGGVRLPDVEVPRARYSGLAADGTLSLSGSTTPFDEALLARLYPDDATYRARRAAAVERAVAAGVLRPEDAAVA